MNKNTTEGLDVVFGNQEGIIYHQTTEFAKSLEVAIRKFAPAPVADKYVAQLNELVTQKAEIFQGLAEVGQDVGACEALVAKELDALKITLETKLELDAAHCKALDMEHKNYVRDVLLGVA